MERGRVLLVAAAMMMLSACGGGGSNGSTGGAGGTGGNTGGTGGGTGTESTATVSVKIDLTSVSLAWEQGDTPREGAVRLSTSGSTPSPIYVGIGTAGGPADPNIERVLVDMQSATAASVRVIPKPGLSNGVYSGSIKVLACVDSACTKSYAGSPFDVAYSFTVTPPASAFDASPRLLTLETESGRSAAQRVLVTLPPGMSTYTATPSDPAVLVDELQAGSFRVTVPARAIGSYTSTVEVAAGTMKRTVTVQHNATPRRLKLAQSRLDLSRTSGSSASAELRLSQAAEGQTTVGVSADGNPWLGIVPSSGGWTVTAASLPSGRYLGSVSVQSGPDRVTVPVRYEVAAPAGGEWDLDVDQPAVTLASTVGGPAARQAVAVRRPSWSGRLDLSVAYENGAGWLDAKVDAPGGLSLSAEPSGLAPGTYRALATLGSAWPSRPVRVAVSFTVGDGMAVPAPQTRVLDGNPGVSATTGAFPVRSTLGTGLAWTASTGTPWLRLKASSGSAGSAVEYEIDAAQAAALPAFVDVEGSIAIAARSATGAVLAPVAAGVTLRRETAEIQAASPAVIVADTDVEIIVRGRGFDRLSPAELSRLAIDGTPVGSVRRLSDTTLKVALSAPAAGEHVLSLPDTPGAAGGTAVVRAIGAAALPGAVLATGGSVRTVLHDALRRQILVANTGSGAIQRYRETPAGWSVDRLAIADLFDIGLSPDGSWLLATERGGRLHLVDPVTLAIGASYTAPGALYPIPSSGHGIAVTNDGRAWLTMAGGAGAGNSMVSFDLRTRRFTAERPAGVAAAFDGGPWYETSRDGERLLVVQGSTGTPPPPMLYVDMAQGLWRSAPADLTFFYFSLNGLSDDGKRSVVLGNVFDGEFGFVGRPRIPDAGYTDSAAMLSPDGRRLYVFSLPDDWNDAAATRLPRLYVFDATAPLKDTFDLPLRQIVDLTAYPTCRLQTVSGECSRPMMNVSADSRTVFVAGSEKLLVIPAP